MFARSLFLVFFLSLSACKQAPQGGLLFASARNGNWEIYLQDTAGIQNLTHYPAGERYPDWAPGGQEFVFVSDREGSFNLYLANRDGSNLRALSHSPFPDTRPRWSASRNAIVFVSERAERDEEIYWVKPDQQEAQRFTQSPGPDYDPAWFPDGQSLVFVSQRSGYSELYRQSFDQAEPKALTGDTLDKRTPDVAPDGEHIAYTVNEGDKWHIKVLNLKKQTSQTHYSHAGWLGEVRWRDNKSLHFVQVNGGQSQLMQLRLGDAMPTLIFEDHFAREASQF